MIRNLEQMEDTERITGDLSCCGGSKGRKLEVFMAEHDWDDVRTTQHTHTWGKHKCKIDRVFTRG